jgi:hypothetical protein
MKLATPPTGFRLRATGRARPRLGSAGDASVNNPKGEVPRQESQGNVGKLVPVIGG